MAIDTTLLAALIAVTPSPGGHWSKATLQEILDNIAQIEPLPAVGTTGQVLTTISGVWTADDVDALPVVGTEGQVLTTVSGAWTAADIDALPTVGTEGQVLTTVSGVWTAADIDALPTITSSTDTLVFTVVSGATTATWSLGVAGPTGATGAAGADGGFDSVQGIVTVTADKTLALTDVGDLLKVTVSAEITIPPNSSVAFDVGQHIDIIAYTANNVDILAGSGVTLRAPYGGRLKTQYGAATLVKIASDEWVLIGDCEAIV